MNLVGRDSKETSLSRRLHTAQQQRLRCPTGQTLRPSHETSCEGQLWPPAGCKHQLVIYKMETIVLQGPQSCCEDCVTHLPQSAYGTVLAHCDCSIDVVMMRKRRRRKWRRRGLGVSYLTGLWESDIDVAGATLVVTGTSSFGMLSTSEPCFLSPAQMGVFWCGSGDHGLPPGFHSCPDSRITRNSCNLGIHFTSCLFIFSDFYGG